MSKDCYLAFCLVHELESIRLVVEEHLLHPFLIHMNSHLADFSLLVFESSEGRVHFDSFIAGLKLLDMHYLFHSITNVDELDILAKLAVF